MSIDVPPGRDDLHVEWLQELQELEDFQIVERPRPAAAPAPGPSPEPRPRTRPRRQAQRRRGTSTVVGGRRTTAAHPVPAPAPAPVVPEPPAPPSAGEQRALVVYRLLRTHPLRALVSSRPMARATLAVLCAVAALLRLLPSGHDLRLDEAQSIQFASHPLVSGAQPSLFLTTAADVHPPGYLLLLHFWMQLAGTDTYLVRLPSAIAGILCVPALYLLGRALYGRRVGLIAALIGTVSPIWIWHAQEARMYPFVLLFTLLSTWLLITALRTGERRRFAGFAVFSVLAVYTHYFALLVLLAQGIYILLERRPETRRRTLAGLACVAGTLAVLVPWGLVVVHNYRGASDPALGALTLYTPLITLVQLVAGYLTTPLMSQVVAAWPLLVLVALGIGVFGGRISSAGRLLWLLVLIPVLIAVGVTLMAKPVFSTRYLIVVTPALYVMISRAMSRALRHDVRASVVALLTCALVGGWMIQSLSILNPAEERYSTLVGYLEDHAAPTDAVLLDAGFAQFPYLYYSHNNLPAYTYPPPDATATVSDAQLAQYLTSVSAGRQHLWALFDLDTSTDATQRVRHWLDYHTSGRTVVEGGRYGRNVPGDNDSMVNVQLVRYDVIPGKSLAQRTRPLTVAELRALADLSPTTRQPFAGPTSRPGTLATLLGVPQAPAARRSGWTMPALPYLASSSQLSLENANTFSMTVTLRRSGDRPLQLYVPARSELELTPAAAGGPLTEAFTLQGTAPFVAARDLGDASRSVRIYGDA
ncbi:MAG TPA: glycosyltransferase family 39 protein [Candidatus Dormibacteraeota bacterium]|nr:glycosyltransferase family 39 protein [Candidatus Dormibacteraeota bacterium]